MRMRKPLVNAAENFGREENLSLVLIPTMSRDMDEQLKVAHKVVDVMDRPYRNSCLTLLRYNMDTSESSYAQVRLFAMKENYGKIQQFVYVKYKLEEYIYLLDVMISVGDKVITNQPICNGIKRVIYSIHSSSFFFCSSQGEFDLWR